MTRPKPAARRRGVDSRRARGPAAGARAGRQHPGYSGFRAAGRISMDDVTAYARRLLQSGGAGKPAAAAASLPDFSAWGAVERKPMSGVRRTTAHRLTQAWNTVPHVFQHDRADITSVEVLRKRLSKKAEADKRAPITITAFLMKTLAAALKKFPQMNSSVDLGVGRSHLQAVRPHRRGRGHRSRPAGAGDPRRRSEGPGSDRRRHRAGGRKSPHPEAVAGRHAGRLDDDFQSRRPGRRRLHADRELARRWPSSAWRARAWSRSSPTASSCRGS